VRFETRAGVAINGIGVADPARQARRGDSAAEQTQMVMLPGDLALKPLEPLLCGAGVAQLHDAHIAAG
jgi:hypothetical protein